MPLVNTYQINSPFGRGYGLASSVVYAKNDILAAYVEPEVLQRELIFILKSLQFPFKNKY
jgi:hypothetical protein